MKNTIAVVDDRNRFLRWTDRAEVHGAHLPHRSVHVMVFDPRGALLVQQRRADKLTYPSYWDVSVAGHVELEDYPAGPDDQLDLVYEKVARRELLEELSIVAPVVEVHREGPVPGVHYEHLRLYEVVWNGTIMIQADEVQGIRWIEPKQWDKAREGLKVTRALDHWVAWLREQGRFLP